MRPNRSLDPRWFWWMLAGVGLVFLFMGARLVFLGAWPVIPFMLIDIGLLYWAFRQSYRSGRALEQVRLADGQLTVRRVTPYGQERTIRLEPFWTRVHLEELNADENRLWLLCKQSRVSVGRFLSPAERVEIAGLLRDALARFKDRR